MHGEWDGSLAIKNASPEKFDFELEISPDLDVAPIGRLGGTAKLQDGHYWYDDGSCTIDFQHVADEPGAQRGDLFVNANISCGLMLGIDGHMTSSTADQLVRRLAVLDQEQEHGFGTPMSARGA